MIFKSARLYRLTKPFDLSAEELEKQLAEFAYTPCESFQFSSFGWIEPLGKHGKMLSHVANGRLMICACKEERLLPAGVIRDVVEEEVDLIETEQARRVFPSEKRRIKEDVIQRLLPQAFGKRRKIFAYIDPKANLLVIESTTLKLAEELIQLLRKTLGSLPVVPLITQQSPASVLSHWLLKSSIDSDFSTGDVCVLRDQSDSQVVMRTKGLDIHSKDFTLFIDAGMQVIRLTLVWKNKIQFELNEDLGMSKIRFDDLIKESHDAVDHDDAAARFDADFVLMTATFNDLFKDLLDALGGIDESIAE